MVHILFFTVIRIAYILRKNDTARQKAPFIILFLFSALRYGYGNDYNNYLRRFNLIHSGMRSGIFEPGYELMNIVFPNFYCIVFVTSFFYIITIYSLIKNNVKKEYIWVALGIFLINPYLFLMNLSSIRQCIAMCIFIFGVRYITEKNFVKYAAALVIAFLFHKSAILLLPVYFFINTKALNRKQLFIIVAAVAFLLVKFDFNTLMYMVARLFNDPNYLHYSSMGLTNTLRATFLTGIFAVYALMNTRKVTGKNAIYLKLYLIGTIMGVLAFRFSIITRMQMYFDIFSVVAIPAIMEQTPMTGKLYIKIKRPVATVMDAVNRYVLPCTIRMIYILRYYSFFTNPMWASFRTYRTIFSVF